MRLKTVKHNADRCRGQSVVEMFILFGIVIIALLAFTRTGGVFQNAVNATMEGSANYLDLNI